MPRRLLLLSMLGLSAAVGPASTAVAAPATPTSLRATPAALAVDLDWSGAPSADAEPQTQAVEPPLRVDGTVLRDRTGRRVGLRGVAVQMVPFYAGSTATTRDSFLARVTERNFRQRAEEFKTLAGLGYSAIRVHIPGPSVYASELYETKAESVERIVAIVAAAKAEGLVTILDSDAIGNAMVNWRDYKPIFSDLIASVGDNPWVVWEPLNEPADYVAGAPSYLAAVKGIGAYLRSLGARQPLILPCNEYQQRVSPVLMDDILDDATTHGWRASGLLFGVHPYLDHFLAMPGSPGDVFAGPAREALERGIAANVAGYPLIVTEMGRYNNAITTTNATRDAYKWVSSLGAAGLNGFIAWDWDWALDEQASDPNAWTWDGLHLNPWGRQSHYEALSKMRFSEVEASAAVAYRVYSEDGAGWRLVSSSGALTYRDEGLSAGKEYLYRVTAVDAAGEESASSSVVFASPVAGPPTSVALEPQEQQPGERSAPPASQVVASPAPGPSQSGPQAPRARARTPAAAVSPAFSRGLVSPPAGSAVIKGKVLRVQLPEAVGHARKIKLTLSGRARQRVVKASRTMTIRSGKRSLAWGLPGRILDAPSLAVRASEGGRGRACVASSSICWVPVASWKAISTRSVGRTNSR